jgi:hypothetical protein
MKQRTPFCYSENMVETELSFFTYTCDRCGALLCERVQLMNLALNYVEDLYCLTCLATEQDMPEPELAEFAKDYVYSRECFKMPWDKFDAKPCPRLQHQQCFCQDHP